MPNASLPLPRRQRPWWIIVILASIVIGVGVFLFVRSQREEEPVKFLTAKLTRGEVVQAIEATGTVQPVVQVQVGSQVSGTILRLHADFNTRVHQGDLLAELDPQPFESRIAEARAAMLSAQSQLTRARAELDLQQRNLARAVNLRERQLNAPSEVEAATAARDTAQAQVQVASAEIARSRAALDSASTNMKYARITAPIDGVVITRSVDVGQTVAASFQTPTLFLIANDLTHMRVIADVDEADVGVLRVGLVAEARVDAFPREKFRGVVQEVRFAPTTTAGVVTYPAVIDIQNPDLKLRPGMTATVTVTTETQRNVLRAPNAALRFQPSTNSPEPRRRADDAVYVLRAGKPVRVRVEQGISDGAFTSIESPELRVGDELVLDEVDPSAEQGASAGGRPSGGGGGKGGGRMKRIF